MFRLSIIPNHRSELVTFNAGVARWDLSLVFTSLSTYRKVAKIMPTISVTIGFFLFSLFLFSQCVRLIDDSSLSQLVMPLVELIRAGGGTGGGSSAAGGSRGTGANSVAAVATATCIFLSHLALSSSSSSSSALTTQSSPQCELLSLTEIHALISNSQTVLYV